VPRPEEAHLGLRLVEQALAAIKDPQGGGSRAFLSVRMRARPSPPPTNDNATRLRCRMSRRSNYCYCVAISRAARCRLGVVICDRATTFGLTASVPSHACRGRCGAKNARLAPFVVVSRCKNKWQQRSVAAQWPSRGGPPEAGSDSWTWWARVQQLCNSRVWSGRGSFAAQLGQCIVGAVEKARYGQDAGIAASRIRNVGRDHRDLRIWPPRRRIARSNSRRRSLLASSR